MYGAFEILFCLHSLIHELLDIHVNFPTNREGCARIPAPVPAHAPTATAAGSSFDFRTVLEFN
jgi:hypothetical protein